MNAPRFQTKTKQLTTLVMEVIEKAGKPLKKKEIAKRTGISIKKMNSLTNTWKDASKRTDDPSFPRIVGSHWWGTLDMQNTATSMGWTHGRGDGGGWNQHHVDTLFLDNATPRQRMVARYAKTPSRTRVVETKTPPAPKETREDHLMEARRLCDRALDMLPRNRETMLAYRAVFDALIRIDRAIHD